MYISEGYNHIFAYALGKLALIAGQADHKVHMELLTDLLNLADNFLQLFRLHARDFQEAVKIHLL